MDELEIYTACRQSVLKGTPFFAQMLKGGFDVTKPPRDNTAPFIVWCLRTNYEPSSLVRKRCKNALRLILDHGCINTKNDLRSYIDTWPVWPSWKEIYLLLEYGMAISMMHYKNMHARKCTMCVQHINKTKETCVMLIWLVHEKKILLNKDVVMDIVKRIYDQRMN